MARQDPKFVDAENDMLHYFHHFTDRLKSRYGIEISFDEYIDLCKQDIDLLYVLTPNKRVGYIEIKGKNVMVVRCNAARLLNTCLRKGQPLMTPNRYKNQGISMDQFNNDLNFALLKIEIMAEWISENPGRDKEFFTGNIFNAPSWMYGAAKKKAQNRDHHWFATVIKNLYNK